MAQYHNPLKIKYFRNTYFHISRQRRHRLSLKRFGVDRPCLLHSQDLDNKDARHYTCGTWHCYVTIDFSFTVGGGGGVRNFATPLYLKFEVFGMWGYVWCKHRRGSSKCVHCVGSQTARVSIHAALITRKFSRFLSLL